MIDVSTNLDLELLCDDEDLEEIQEIMHEKECSGSKETNKLIQKFRQVQHLRATSNGQTILGIPSSPPPQLIVAVTSLVKQKLNSVKFIPGSRLSNACTTQRSVGPSVTTQQVGPRIQATQAGSRQSSPIHVTPILPRSSTNPVRFSSTGQNLVTMNPTSSSTSTTHISIDSGSRVRFPNGQELSLNQFQSLLNKRHGQSQPYQNNIRAPLLFDATTGTFLVPYPNPNTSQTHTLNKGYSNSTSIPTIPDTSSIPIITSVTGSISGRPGLAVLDGTHSVQTSTPSTLPEGITVSSSTRETVPIPLAITSQSQQLMHPSNSRPRPPVKTVPRMLIQHLKNPVSASASKVSTPPVRSIAPAPKVNSVGTRFTSSATQGSMGGATVKQAKPDIVRAQAQDQAQKPKAKKGWTLVKGPESKASDNIQGKESTTKLSCSISSMKPSSKSNTNTSWASQPKASIPKAKKENTEKVTQIRSTKSQSGSNGSKVESSDIAATKTYPSLLVSVKPILGERLGRSALNQRRAALDARVKALIQLNPAKLVEKLMQLGLLRVEHYCENHVTSEGLPVPFKLGMYSSPEKMPESGGYTWVSDCCANKQISVLHGSIFQEAPYPPVTMLKLIYHWCCQTSVSQVVSWVKVTNLCIKNFYTLLRSCCVAALNEFCPVMGGNQQYVEIGIVTLSSSPVNGPSVKLEFLGAFDPTAKIVRMRLLNPGAKSFNSYKRDRVSEFLAPLKEWVHKSSCVLIDETIDKHLMTELGFRSVIQCKGGSPAPVRPGQAYPPSNINIRNYLKGMLGKMFQNTVHVLSKTLIQLFLDELSWRERWGHNSAEAFEHITNHLIFMTKKDSSENNTLFSRLTKISNNPFTDYCRNQKNEAIGIDSLPDSIRNVGQVYNGSATDSASESSPPSGPPDLRQIQESGDLKRKAIELERSELRDYYSNTPNTVDLYKYYFTTCSGKYIPRLEIKDFPATLKCPMCSKTFQTKADIIPHVYGHIVEQSRLISQKHNCPYCLKGHSNLKDLEGHISDMHLLENSKYPCVICEEKFFTLRPLVLHMWEKHSKAEMPYRCEICDYRSSRQSDVVGHFKHVHYATDSVLCPFCLKVVVCNNGPGVREVVEHLQNHIELTKRRKCPQCCLVFLNEADYRAHIYEGAHLQDSYPDGRVVTPINFANNLVMPAPPPVSRDRFDPDQRFKRGRPLGSVKKTYGPAGKGASLLKPTIIIDEGLDATANRHFHEYTFHLPPGEDETEIYSCTECLRSITTSDHYPGLMGCVKCNVNTSCQPTIINHNRDVHPIGPVQPTKNYSCLDVRPIGYMNVPMSCVCGFRSSRAEVLMIHLQACGRLVVFSV